MLSNRIIKHFGIRVKSMVYTGLTIYGWDNDNQELTPPPKKWLYWNWNVSNSMGYCLCGCYGVYIYFKLSSLDEEPDTRMTSFATLVFAWGELIVIQVINMLASRIRTMQKEILFLMNQLFKYHKQQSAWMEEREITLDLAHKKRILVGELIGLGGGYFSYIFPCIIFAVVFHRLEPIHNMVQDWLEFELTLQNLTWSLLTLVPPLFLSVLAAGNTTLVMGLAGTYYYLVAVAAVEDMTPVQVTRRHNNCRSTFQTQFYGELEDVEIIERYRVQQLFNVLINEIYASLSMSLHHVGCLAAVSVAVFVTVKFPNILEEVGFVAYVIIFGLLIGALAIEYIETLQMGTLVDSSREFKAKCNTLVGRGALMRVFARSCQTFYIQAAYPYFNVEKSTFLGFIDETMDKTITLLLW